MFVQDSLENFANRAQEANWSVLRWSRALTGIFKDRTDRRQFPLVRKTLLLDTTVEQFCNDQRKFRG